MVSRLDSGDTVLGRAGKSGFSAQLQIRKWGSKAGAICF